MTQAVSPIPQGFHTVTPLLVCRNAPQALEFYHNAFDAKVQSESKDLTGKITHAQFKIGDSILMLTEEFPDWHCLSPLSIGGTAVTLHIYTPDADAAFTKAVGAGAQVAMPIMDAFWGDRYGEIVDPFGHKWSIATRKQILTEEEKAAAAKKAFAEMGKGSSAG
jgi:PhnB protein